jgi:hypothetical protein
MSIQMQTEMFCNKKGLRAGCTEAPSLMVDPDQFVVLFDSLRNSSISGWPTRPAASL